MHARYLEDHGDRIVLVPSPLDRLARGALLAFIIAPTVLACGSSAAWIAAGDDFSFVIGWGVTALLAGGIALFGLVRMAGAPRIVERAVRMNLAERVLERPGSAVEVLRGIDAVRVRAGRWPWSGFSLELAHDDGRSTPLLNAPRGRGHELAKAAEHLADVLDARTEIAARAERDRPFIPRDPRLAGALCYMPIDGLSQALAVYYLMTSIDPFVRFNAKQSLLMIPVELAGFLAFGGCFGAPVAMFVHDHQSGAALACPLVVFAGIRAAVRTAAAMRAHRGMVWIQPWLAPIARRWAPL